MQFGADSNPESIATCPYNPAHRLPLFRMKRHLVKCRRSYPDTAIVTCPLNIEHRILQPELAYHVERCPDRVDLDRKIYIPEVIDRVTAIEIPETIPQSGDECWDDADHPTYDPTKHVMENPILRTLSCESKAKRREFRLQERIRISRINADLDRASTSTALHAEEPTGKSDGACRRPLTQSAALTDKRSLDPYKVNDLMQALTKDQQQMLKNLQNMGEDQTLVTFPIEDTAQDEATGNIQLEKAPYTATGFPALASPSHGRVHSGNNGKHDYTASFQNYREHTKK